MPHTSTFRWRAGYEHGHAGRVQFAEARRGRGGDATDALLDTFADSTAADADTLNVVRAVAVVRAGDHHPAVPPVCRFQRGERLLSATLPGLTSHPGFGDYPRWSSPNVAINTSGDNHHLRVAALSHSRAAELFRRCRLKPPHGRRVTTVSATTTADRGGCLATTIPAPAALLIRPDGYVAWISDAQRTGGLCETITARSAADSRVPKKGSSHEQQPTTDVDDVLIVGAGPAEKTLHHSGQPLIAWSSTATRPSGRCPSGFVQPRTLEYLRRMACRPDDRRRVGPWGRVRRCGAGPHSTVVRNRRQPLSVPVDDLQSQTQRRSTSVLQSSVGLFCGGGLLDLVPEFPEALPPLDWMRAASHRCPLRRVMARRARAADRLHRFPAAHRSRRLRWLTLG